MSTFVSRDFRRGGPKSREEMTSFQKIDHELHIPTIQTERQTMLHAYM